jgi:DNA-binding NarL/FixJ family response regulator
MPTAKKSLHALRSPNPADGLLSAEDWLRVAGHVGLSTAQTKVAICLFEGKTRRQIAHQLRRSQATVRTHIDRVFAKLHVNDRVSFVQRVMQIHLATLNGSTDSSL